MGLKHKSVKQISALTLLKKKKEIQTTDKMYKFSPQIIYLFLFDMLQGLFISRHKLLSISCSERFISGG